MPEEPVRGDYSAGIALVLVAGTMVSTYFAIQADQQAKQAIRQRTRAEANALAASARELEAAAVLQFCQR